MKRDKERIRTLRSFERRLGYRFRRRTLLSVAVTHPSYANEQGLEEHFERLEFLGDAVLGLVTAEWLFTAHPEVAEGTLSKWKSFLVSEPVLAAYAKRIDLGVALALGVGEERSGGRRKPSILADALEAVFGAAFLDGGLRAARATIRPLLEEAAAVRRDLGYGDAKTRLQEVLQGRGDELPEYRLVAESGPDHAKRFRVECRCGSRRLGEGEGPSKKVAEQRAAAAALARLDAAGPREGAEAR